MSAELVKPPTRSELESLTLADRIALEDAFGEATEVLRELNDAEIGRLAEAGESIRSIAKRAGRSQGWAQYRLAKLGLREMAPSKVTEISHPQNGDTPEDVVDAEVVEPDAVFDPEPPVGHLPDFVAPDAAHNLRTVSLRWFQWGRDVKELLEDGVDVEPKSREDKQAIKEQADLMVKVARALKGTL